MRVHLQLDAELVAELDRRAGARGRSELVARLLTRALDEQRRWERIEGAIGALDDAGHEWDHDPAGRVAEQRRTDPRRTG